MRWAARMGEIYRLLVGIPERRRPLGRPRHRWVDNIKKELGEMRWDGVDSIGLAQDRNKWRAFVHLVMNFWFHTNSIELVS
jgi:hypothetical protein